MNACKDFRIEYAPWLNNQSGKTGERREQGYFWPRRPSSSPTAAAPGLNTTCNESGWATETDGAGVRIP